ncbi:tape measure protein [Larkinella soli]|uniref:tape measure protein n=1 Tax=Larkinella soli TaxID=1770527 RepID=UPI000FFBF443|nr:tape measure protein [Larkinella soli]
MPNPIRPEEVIDIPGLKAGLSDLQQQMAGWLTESKRLFGELVATSKDLQGELGRTRVSLASEGDLRKLAEYDQRVDQLSARLRENQKAAKAVEAAEHQLQTVQQSLTQRTEELMKRYAELNGTSAKVVAEKKRIAKELVSLTANFEQLGRAVNTSKGSVSETANTYSALSRRLAEMRSQLRSLDGAFDANTGKLNQNNRAAVQLAASIQRTDTALKRMDATMGVHGRQVGSYQQTIAGAYLGFTRFAGSIITLQAILGEGKAIVGAAIQMESLNAALKAVHTSAEEAAISERFIKEEASRLGAELGSTADAFITLAGATRGTTLEGAETRRIWDSIIVAGRGLNRTNEQIQRAIIATGQVFSKQKVQAEDLVGQLAEAMPGALQILAKELGVTVSQMLEMGQKGQLLADEVLPKLADGFQKTFGDKVAENSDRTASNLNRMRNALTELRATVFNDTDANSWFSRLLKAETEEMKDWIYIFQNWSKLSVLRGDLGGDNVRRLRQAEAAKRKPIDDFRKMNAEQRNQAILKASSSSLTLGNQFDAASGDQKKIIGQRMADAQRLVDEMVKIDLKMLGEEKERAEEVAKKRAAMQAEQREKDQKKQAVKDRQALAERERKLRDALQKIEAGNDLDESRLRANFEAGLMTEAEYIDKRYEMQVEGARKELRLLVESGKANTDEYNKAQKKVTDALANAQKDRKQMEDKAWRKAVEAVRDGLRVIDDQTQTGLTKRLADLEKAYVKAEQNIERQVAQRQMTEEAGQKAVFDLRNKYLDDIAKATSEAYDEDEKRSTELLDKLAASAKGETQIKEAAALKAEEIEKNQLDKQKDAADASVKITEDAEKQKTKITKDEAEKRQALEEMAWQLASQAVTSYLEITGANRQQDIERLEKQKDYELSLVQDNEEAKTQIEQRYNERLRVLRRRQAEADKAQAAFEIILNTAVGATNAASKAVTLPLVPFIIALGALQLGTVLAKPIPEFFKGKKDGYEGPGYVGDRGFEIVERRDSNGGHLTYQLAPTRQLTYLHRHDKVYTHEESKRMIQVNREIADNIRQSAPLPWESSTDRRYTSADMAQAVESGMRKAMKDQPVQENHWDDLGYRRYLRDKNQRTQWLNNWFSFPKSKH